MEKTRLDQVAKVEISGVDKKTKPGQQIVRLCNFTDVYYNWAITQDMRDSFMVASASQKEIDSLSLHKGQVALTKDSETRDDIGVSTYIADDFDDVVLGYHTALITPDETKLNGKYLNAFLHTPYMQKYFAFNASGSGQRYTLSIEALNAIQLILPSLEEQERIGNLFSLLDRKISLNRSINKELEEMAKEIYDYWFVQFDFPDAKGRPYKSSGGTMIYNSVLNREIPEGWEANKLLDLLDNGRIQQINPQNNPSCIYKHLSFPSYDECKSYNEELGADIHSNKIVVTDNYVLAAKLNPWIKRIAWGESRENLICSTEFVVLSPKEKKIKPFIYILANQQDFIDYCTSSSTGTSHSQRRVKPEIMKQYVFAYNHSIALKFATIISTLISKQQASIEEIKELQKQRDELLPLLMTGQVKIS